MGENFSLSPEIVRLRALKIDHHGDVPPDREDKKLEILKNLRSIKEDYKSGIPNEIKHSTDEDPKWKVRKAWFQVVVFCLAGILKMYVEDVRGGVDPIITEELANEIFTYRGKLINPPKKGLTTQQDIDEAETVIDKIIKELS